ncbi:hypothetical protein CI610_03035 [invertebrate metagenome]|uniref:Uncharacterized protein n=1 Tax=invertebrate metagenome TaxID=1711999 RepID=A0A2H9T4A6_9ZZZZ
MTNFFEGEWPQDTGIEAFYMDISGGCIVGNLAEKPRAYAPVTINDFSSFAR